MTFWDWIRSIVIFTAGVFILNNFFISLTLLEAIILMAFLGIGIFHVADLRDEFLKKLKAVRAKRNPKSEEEV